MTVESQLSDVRWVRVPHQDRSRKTLERLLDAAEQLLQERGFDNVTVSEIAQAAGSSVGAFYARFRDKNGLLHHLHERHCDETIATADAMLDPARWESAGAAEVLREVVTLMAEMFRTRSGMFRAFMAVGHSDAEFLERERRMLNHVLSRLTTLLLERKDELHHPDPAAAIAFGVELCAAVLRDRYVLGTDELGLWPRLREGLAPELIRVYARYLGLEMNADGPARGKRGAAK